MNIIEVLKHQQIFAVAEGIQSAFIAFIILSVIALVFLGILYLSIDEELDGDDIKKCNSLRSIIRKTSLIILIILVFCIIGERTSASFKNASKVIILEFNSSFF